MSCVTMNNNNWTDFGTIERFKDMKCDSIDNPMALLEFKKRKLPEKRQWDFQKGIGILMYLFITWEKILNYQKVSMAKSIANRCGNENINDNCPCFSIKHFEQYTTHFCQCAGIL